MQNTFLVTVIECFGDEYCQIHCSIRAKDVVGVNLELIIVWRCWSCCRGKWTVPFSQRDGCVLAGLLCSHRWKPIVYRSIGRLLFSLVRSNCFDLVLRRSLWQFLTRWRRLARVNGRVYINRNYIAGWLMRQNNESGNAHFFFVEYIADGSSEKGPRNRSVVSGLGLYLGSMASSLLFLVRRTMFSRFLSSSTNVTEKHIHASCTIHTHTQQACVHHLLYINTQTPKNIYTIYIYLYI